MRISSYNYLHCSGDNSLGVSYPALGKGLNITLVVLLDLNLIDPSNGIRATSPHFDNDSWFTLVNTSRLLEPQLPDSTILDTSSLTNHTDMVSDPPAIASSDSFPCIIHEPLLIDEPSTAPTNPLRISYSNPLDFSVSSTTTTEQADRLSDTLTISTTRNHPGPSDSTIHNVSDSSMISQFSVASNLIAISGPTGNSNNTIAGVFHIWAVQQTSVEQPLAQLQPISSTTNTFTHLQSTTTPSNQQFDPRTPTTLVTSHRHAQASPDRTMQISTKKRHRSPTSDNEYKKLRGARRRKKRTGPYDQCLGPWDLTASSRPEPTRRRSDLEKKNRIAVIKAGGPCQYCYFVKLQVEFPRTDSVHTELPLKR